MYTLLRKVSARLILYIRERFKIRRSARYFSLVFARWIFNYILELTCNMRTWSILLRDKSEKLLLTSNLHLTWFICTFRTKVWSYHHKSNWILFSNRKRSVKEDSIFKIFSNTRLVERVLNVRFLGVILDCKFKGEDHFKQVIKKEKSLINVLSSLAAIWWFSFPALITIYRAVFRGSEYGCQIFVL